MKFLFNFGIMINILLALIHMPTVQSAAIICETPTTAHQLTESSGPKEKSSNQTVQSNNQDNEINKFLHKIQCTLEKAKPWMDELQQEAKRLEQAAKLLGLGILNSFGEFIDKLAEEDKETSVVNSGATLLVNGNGNGSLSANATIEAATTELISPYLCPEGFLADHNGICERADLAD